MPVATEALTREQWLLQRGSFIGASEIAAIIGISPYMDIGNLWLSKVKAMERLEAPEDATFDYDTESHFMLFGRLLEPVILGVYEEQTGYTVHRPGLQIFRHPEYPFIAATLDAYAITDFGDKRTAEAKNVDSFAQWRGRQWGEEGTDEVPPHYAVQGIQQMLVREHEGFATVCDFPVLFGGNTFKVFSVQYDRELAAQIIELAGWFWGLVTRREAPPMNFAAKNATKLQRRLYDKIVGETKVLTDPQEAQRALGLIAARDHAHEQGKYWVGEKGEGGVKGAATAELLNIAGDYGRVEIPLEVGGKIKTFAINRKPKAGYDVAAYTVDPSIALTFEPYQLKKREEIFNGIKAEQKQDEAGTGQRAVAGVQDHHQSAASTAAEQQAIAGSIGDE